MDHDHNHGSGGRFRVALRSKNIVLLDEEKGFKSLKTFAETKTPRQWETSLFPQLQRIVQARWNPANNAQEDLRLVLKDEAAKGGARSTDHMCWL